MPTSEGPWDRFRGGFLRFWRSEDPKLRALRDVGVATSVVVLVLGTIWTYSGQGFPSTAPLVVVESGSMMHGPNSPCLPGDCIKLDAPSFGRVGTIDPGDLVIVKDVDRIEDVATAFDASRRDGYGGHGDVIVFQRSGLGTPIIHRAMLRVHVEPEGCAPNAAQTPCRYRIPETCAGDVFMHFVVSSGPVGDWGKYCDGSTDPIELRLERDGIHLALNHYPCSSLASCPAPPSGIITKGDNNPTIDQPVPYEGPTCGRAAACGPVTASQLIGKARGEIPWFGLIKLAFFRNDAYDPSSDPTGDANWKILGARAPWDLWVMLFVVVGVLVAAPVAYDLTMGRLRARDPERRR